MNRFSPILAVAAQTVDTFSRITGRTLSLKDGKRARTNGRDIVVPFSDADPYLLVERQLAHVLFRSDARARDTFVKEFVSRTVAVAWKQDMPGRDFAEAEEFVTQLVNVLESRRVESLWAMLYPGSHARSRRRLLVETNSRVQYAHDTISDMLVCVDAGHPLPAGQLDMFRADVEQALKKVERRGFEASLIMARWLVSRIVDKVVEEKRKQKQSTPKPGNQGAPGKADEKQPPKVEEAPPTPTGRERMEGLRDAIALGGSLPPDLSARYDNYDPITGDSALTREAKAAAAAALAADLRDGTSVDTLLNRSQERMQTVLDRVEESLSSRNKPPREQALTSHIDARIEFVDVDGSATPLTTVDLEPSDILAIAQLRATFRRVMGRRDRSLDDTGTEVDVGAYIERRTSGTDIPCFKSSKRGRGFRVLILIDRSQSMRGARTQQAERGARILLDALDFPFVDVELWGFQNINDGEVIITRFHKDMTSFETDRSVVDGGTPMHIAVNIAVRELMDGQQARHLILITDGAPMYAGFDEKLIADKTLRRQVRESVVLGRKRGVHITSLLVGGRTKSGKIKFESTPAEVYEMFGPEKHWHFVDDDSFASDLVRTVTTSFVAYLKHS